MKRRQAQLLTILLAGLLAAGPAVAGRAGEPEPPSGQTPDILALSPEIEEFLDQRVRSDQPRGAVVRSLMDALFGKNGVDILYGNLETKTAVETFETGSGNCLSFTVLFVAMARHVGLTAHFQEVMEILSWDRKGEVAVNNRHMFAEVETPTGLLQVDFLPGVEKRYRAVRRIDEQRVLAHYFNNLGAEALAEEDWDRSFELLSKALEADENFAPAWVNRGVAHRLLGRHEEAEHAYLEALRIDPQEISAAANLATLYRKQGDDRKARPYLKRARRHERRNPFHHFRLGLQAANQDRNRDAVVYLQRAIRRLPEDALFRLELAQLYARMGKRRAAERQVARAVALAVPGEELEHVEILAREIRAGLEQNGSRRGGSRRDGSRRNG